MKLYKQIFSTTLFILLLLSYKSFSQETAPASKKHFYFSWGYNTEWYSTSDIHIEQPKLNNDYVFNNTKAHDRIGWNRLFQVPLTIPQYNYRIGYFFDKEQNWAIELNFDHTKYVVTEGQAIQVTGTMNGNRIDTVIITSNSTLNYQLNNGANFFLFNLVRKVGLFTTNSKKFQLDFLGKAGIGPLIPHVQNTIFGVPNTPHFQLGGWNTGVEGTLKATFFKHLYLEFCAKLDYARYSRLRLETGYANHHFVTTELILNLGYMFSINKKQ